jgi:hypothetical protein
MSGPAFTALGVAGGAFFTALASVAVLLAQRRSVLHHEHLLRAFEKHLPEYENVFVSARTAQDSFRNFQVVSGRASDRSDPFLFQLLEIAASSAHQFCVAVSWNHNPGMAYLDLGVEERCLLARDLLLEWLSNQRVHSGDVATIRQNGSVQNVSPVQIRALRVGDYQELRIETRRLVVDAPGDKQRYAEIDRAMSAVISHLRAVMAY